MKNEVKLCCGIDVSKETLDCFFNLHSGEESYLRVTNNEKGFRELFRKCGKRKYQMESSGPYGLNAAIWLKEKGCGVYVENSLVIKRFIQMNMERSKNDKKDARWIFRFGIQQETREWKIPSETQIECQQLLKGIALYNRQRTMLMNQLHSLESMTWQCKKMKRSLSSMITKLGDEIQKLQDQLDIKVESWIPEQSENLQSIPGLGKRAATMLIVFTEGFSKVENYRQLICLAGLSPREFTSGTSIKGKTRICKMGGGQLRNVLYMCSMSAIRKNRACKMLYERLRAKGKNGRLALIAVCNKLLKQAFAIAKSGQRYNEDYLNT